MENITSIIETNDLSGELGTTIKDTFNKYFDEAKKWQEKAMSIVVTDDNDTELMNEARTVRLALRDIRTGAEKKRKLLKAAIVCNGKAIDGVANVLKALVVPIEKHLQEQEDYVAIKLKVEREKIVLDWIDQLSKYTDASLYSFDNMDAFTFANLLDTVKVAHNNKAEAEKQAVIDRELESKVRDTLIKENAQLKADKEKLIETADMVEVDYCKEHKKPVSDNDKIATLISAIEKIAIPDCELYTNKAIISYVQNSLQNILISLHKINKEEQ
jgi:hypothetical protein